MINIKNVTWTTEESGNPINRAINLINSNVDKAVFFSFSVKEEADEDGIIQKFVDTNVKTLDCRMHNVSDCGLFASQVMKTYYHHMMLESKLRYENVLETTGIDDENLRTIANIYHKIDGNVWDLNYATLPNFVRVCASCFSGRWDGFTNPQNVVNCLVSLYNGEKTMDDLRNVLDMYLRTISEKEDTATVKKYWCRANKALTEDVKARYYKGRTVGTKNGKVKKSFDKNGSSVRREIILAIIEMMQAKLRSSSFGFEFNKKTEDQKTEDKSQKTEDQKTEDKKADKGKAGKKAPKTLFRELCKKFHPDNNKTAEAEEIFKAVNKAYTEKNYEELRKLYNKYM